MFKSVLYNAPGSGEQRQLIAGHMHPTEGLRILALGADDHGGDLCCVLEGGTIVTIPAGSVVVCDPADTPAVPRREPKRGSQRPTDSGRRPAIAFHSGRPGEDGPARIVGVGDVLPEFDSYVVAIIAGDACRILMKSGDVLEIPAGSVLRHLPAYPKQE
jgi:hypothetical protein